MPSMSNQASSHPIQDRLEEIIESIDLIQLWSKDIPTAQDFLLSYSKVMAFNACVMRLQVIGEHVGKILKEFPSLLEVHPEIPWLAIYDLRNIISHEYANIDEDIIFSIIHKELEPLREAVTSIIKSVNQSFS